MKQLSKEKRTTKEKEVRLVNITGEQVSSLRLKVQFYEEKLKLRLIELLTGFLERRLERRKARMEVGSGKHS